MSLKINKRKEKTKKHDLFLKCMNINLQLSVNFLLKKNIIFVNVFPKSRKLSRLQKKIGFEKVLYISSLDALLSLITYKNAKENLF
jgi:hypothetical protein